MSHLPQLPQPRRPRILVLFDIDGTLSAARAEADEEMHKFLHRLKEEVTVGIVGGSDLAKQQEQMGANIVNEVNYSFSENGLVAYKNGLLIGKEVIRTAPFHTYCHSEFAFSCSQLITTLAKPTSRALSTGLFITSPTWIFL
jgi:hypothetical protein